MKICLISPAPPNQFGRQAKRLFGLYRSTLPYLAALFPEEDEVLLVEESVDGEAAIPAIVSRGYEFFALSPQTASAPRAYELATEIRELGGVVAIGGVHASLLPSEALQYSNAVVVGEAEGSLAAMLSDYRAGHLAPRQGGAGIMYESMPSRDLRGMPAPRWDLMDKSLIDFLRTVEIGRGCPYSCDFCSVGDLFGKAYRLRPIEEIIAEIEATGARRLLFSTDNLSPDRRYMREFFTALRPQNVEWIAQATVDFAEDSELVALAAKSGCKLLLIGFESVSEKSLVAANKGRSQTPDQYHQAVTRLHDHGIAVGGAFIFGLDYDEPGIAERTLEFCTRSQLDSVSSHILTPYPRTRVFERLRNENRLLYQDFPADWARYDTTQVLFQPSQMSCDQLAEEFDTFNREFFSFSSLLRRLRLKSRTTVDLATYFAANAYYSWKTRSARLRRS